MATLTLNKTLEFQGTAGTVIEYPVSGDLIACSDTARLRAAAAAAIHNTPALLSEARGWIEDVFSLELAPTLDTPAAAYIVRIIERNYDGGCIEFYRNSLQLTSNTTRKA